MTGRSVFIAAAAVVLALAAFALVLRPAVERGGVGEVVLIVAFFVVLLVFERWLRTR